LRLEVDADAEARITRFLELRAQWARTHNLAGPRALTAPWRVDVIDGLAIGEIMAPSLPLVDVGAGGGVPGLVVAALYPARPVILVEPRAKRAAFLRTAVYTLELSEARVIRARWPLESALGPHQVVSRAVVSPAQWPSLALQGGSEVLGIIRMLATDRPGFRGQGLELRRAVDYTSAEGDRRVEYWARLGEIASASEAGEAGE
jgi:16S rRNA G527 N7-methylase RsmG